MGEVFEHRDLSGAVFHDVNLHRAVFDGVNLGEATIRDANLRNVTITGANIEGLTIYGIRVDRLIEAEFDRRDPERVSLRMADPHDPRSVRGVMDRLDEVRRQFYAALRAADPDVLVARPSAGKWSAIEQVRHLLFAEDLYFNRWILRNDRPWNPLGLLPAFLGNEATYATVGVQATHDLEAVWAEWDALHVHTRAFVASVTAEQLRRSTSDVDFGQGTVGGVLQGMAQHDLHHIRQAEALIA